LREKIDCDLIGGSADEKNGGTCMSVGTYTELMKRKTLWT